MDTLIALLLSKYLKRVPFNTAIYIIHVVLRLQILAASTVHFDSIFVVS